MGSIDSLVGRFYQVSAEYELNGLKRSKTFELVDRLMSLNNSMKAHTTNIHLKKRGIHRLAGRDRPYNVFNPSDRMDLVSFILKRGHKQITFKERGILRRYAFDFYDNPDYRKHKRAHKSLMANIDNLGSTPYRIIKKLYEMEFDSSKAKQLNAYLKKKGYHINAGRKEYDVGNLDDRFELIEQVMRLGQDRINEKEKKEIVGLHKRVTDSFIKKDIKIQEYMYRPEIKPEPRIPKWKRTYQAIKKKLFSPKKLKTYTAITAALAVGTISGALVYQFRNPPKPEYTQPTVIRMKAPKMPKKQIPRFEVVFPSTPADTEKAPVVAYKNPKPRIADNYEKHKKPTSYKGTSHDKIADGKPIKSPVGDTYDTLPVVKSAQKITYTKAPKVVQEHEANANPLLGKYWNGARVNVDGKYITVNMKGPTDGLELRLKGDSGWIGVEFGKKMSLENNFTQYNILKGGRQVCSGVF